MEYCGSKLRGGLLYVELRKEREKEEGRGRAIRKGEKASERKGGGVGQREIAE